MQLSLFLNNPVVSAGSPLTGTVSLTLDEPTSIDDIYVRFKGISFTARIVNNGQTTYRVTERHSHADIITSLFDQPRGTFLPPGEHILLFTIQVPVYSECTCLAHCDQYSQFRLSRWTCRHSGVDVGLVRTGLPPTCHASRSMYVDYRLVAAVDRPGIFKWKKSVLSTVTLVPATLVHSSSLLYDRDSRNLVEVYKTVVLSAKCDKLPEEYFVQGALPKVSGLKKLISFSSKHTYVDVPMEAEMILYNNGEASIGEHLPFELYISVQVDDISRIVGIVNIKLTSIKVSLRSETSCYAQKHPNSSSDKTILFELNKLDIPLTPEKSEGRAPRFRIDDKVFKAIELGNNIVPDFDIMSFRHHHKICVAVGLSFNDGGTRAVEISHAIIINSGIDYDLDTNMLLPPRYQMADYKYEYDNDRFKTDEEEDFFD
ncbi:hypothetical protein V1520DRAFT_40851 [Lipomyces starkeyi]|uniref:Arrestin-like N-terminal domain-containing protein n=1 Tax=Lipomyces starkeyi NRRL Y-11557 TaxID=675824 RepID=A0A1E3QEU5_LIPST|nr:hypothetical protein LIPSTDRAFT_127128 [Lipomyces starkeyi NRRL Y-11557]